MVAKSTKPRNFLVLMADQLAAQWLPAYGHDAVHAPQIARLASQGVAFDAAYCQFPLCAPSRGAMLAGRYASRIGVYDNAAELAATVPTLVHHLRGAGYRTLLSGKMHFVGPDQLHGFERRLTTDIYPASADWVPDWRRDISDALPWYHTMESILTPARCVASMQTDYDDEVCFQAVRAVRDLARYDDGEPFLLVASFTNPHDPWEIPGRYWDLYEETSIELPAVPALADVQLDPHSRRLRAMCGADRVQLSDEQVRRARHGYYAAISYLDERIGQILDALRETGLDESTWIVLTADHGEFLGERGLWYKMSFLDPAARVPLIMRPPGGGVATRVSVPVSLLDLGPTLLELAGLGSDAVAAADMDGASLAPLLDDAGATVLDDAGGTVLDDAGAMGSERPPVICEYHAEGVTAPAAMIRQGAFKLIVCETDPDQLYHLHDDPAELTNLAGDPAYADVVTRLRLELERRLDLGAIGERVLASQHDRRVVERGLARGVHTAWDYEPRVDASMQYVRARSDLYELQRRARIEMSDPAPGQLREARPGPAHANDDGG
ncbi:MAG TPA: choline-sulfatase [Solirubrobacteraceae bacterium]|nr:choline-sulfatase [Solirubrobacteraceae bacterium]